MIIGGSSVIGLLGVAMVVSGVFARITRAV
jgi:hypothetical protein